MSNTVESAKDEVGETAGEQTVDAEGTQKKGAFGMKSVGRHAFIYGLGIIASKAASFVMLPVYTRYLTPSDYGIISLIEMTLDVISIMAGAQLATGIFRFYHKADDPTEKNTVVSTAMYCLAFGYIAVGAITLVGAGWLAELVFDSRDHTTLIRIASCTLIFSSASIVPVGYARVKDFSTFVVATSVARLLLSLGLNIYTLVFLGMGMMGVFVSSLITTVLMGIFLTGWAIREVGLRFSWGATRDLVRYGTPLMATQVATFLATFSDRYFLNVAADEAAVGLYNMAYQFGFLLAAVGYVPFETVWAPKRFEIAKRDDRDEVLARGFEYENVLLLTCALGISMYVGDVLRIMTTPAFFSAADVVPLILVAYIFQGWAGNQDIGILMREKTQYLTIANWIAAAVGVLGYWILIPLYHSWGAAIATSVAFGVRWLLTYIFSQRLWRVEYKWGPVLKLFALAAGFAGIGLVLPDFSIIVSLAVRTVLILVYAWMAWTFALSPSVRDEIRRVAEPKLKGFWAKIRPADTGSA